MALSETTLSLDALLAEKEALDLRLDEALRAFATFEEEMNQHWRNADATARQTLLAERAQVEESLGIVALVDRLDQIRDQLTRLRGTA